MVPFPQGASMASDPEGIVDTLRELARLDPVELGLQAILDQIVQAATSCCGITGGVGLLLLGPDGQLHYIAVTPRRRSLLATTQIPEREGPSVEAFVHDELVSSADLAAERRWPTFQQQAVAAGLRARLSVPVRQHLGPIGALDFARTDPQPWQPQELATSSGFARLIMATLELATARQQEGSPPRCSSPWSMTPRRTGPRRPHGTKAGR
jgi:GAF domain-containing protein